MLQLQALFFGMQARRTKDEQLEGSALDAIGDEDEMIVDDDDTNKDNDINEIDTLDTLNLGESINDISNDPPTNDDFAATTDVAATPEGEGDLGDLGDSTQRSDSVSTATYVHFIRVACLFPPLK